MKQRGFKTKTAFTIHEIMVAMAVASVVLSVGIICFLTLQRGFVYLGVWSDVRANQVRLLDAMALDLRAAYYVNSTGTSGTLPITITLPQFYSSYEATSSDAYNGRAGDPGRNASTQVNLRARASRLLITGSNTATVTYSMTSNGDSRIINRQIQWSGGSATRQIANFSKNATVTLIDQYNSPLKTQTNLRGDLSNRNPPIAQLAVEAVTDDKFANRSATVLSKIARSVYMRALISDSNSKMYEASAP